MPEGIKYAEDKYPNAAACVVLTDGGTPWGDPSFIPTLWAITEEGIRPAWGEYIHVQVQEEA